VPFGMSLFKEKYIGSRGPEGSTNKDYSHSFLIQIFVLINETALFFHNHFL
jgi:hypothetical protein